MSVSDRARQFVVAYRGLCNEYAMEISTTQDGGLTIACDGSNLSEDDVALARKEWPSRDLFGDGGYVTPAESEASRLRRIARDKEAQDRREFDRLRKEYGASSK